MPRVRLAEDEEVALLIGAVEHVALRSLRAAEEGAAFGFAFHYEEAVRRKGASRLALFL